MKSAELEQLLPDGVRSRHIDNSNGLQVHVLEAGYENPERPCVLLLHGFPELAFSWRKVMPALAAAGYHVIAPDQRGYGETTGWEDGYDCNLGAFRMFNLVRDILGLLNALGRPSIDAVVGHDFGSPVAAYCALLRPDVFRSVALMSAPFGGSPHLPIIGAAPGPEDVHEALAGLERPRKHYQHYYSTRPANNDMWRCAQGVHDFLRAYYHVKSADWVDNRPSPLTAWNATELENLPTYYVMDFDKTMAQTVQPEMPTSEMIARCSWLTEQDMRVYSSTYGRTGFQGGLNWYRCGTDEAMQRELQIYSGVPITVPSCFIAGSADWGVHQKPGAFEAMQTSACSNYRGTHLVSGAGHWVQQEQPDAVSNLLIDFIGNAR